MKAEGKRKKFKKYIYIYGLLKVGKDSPRLQRNKRA